MAIQNLYKCKTATFKTKAIVGAQSVQVDMAGSEQGARSDGAVAQQIAYMEGMHAKVTITALEGSISDADLLMPGTYGSLVCKVAPQVAGKGLGTEKTLTFANALLTGSSRSASLDGNPSVTLTFTCVAETGAEADIMVVS